MKCWRDLSHDCVTTNCPMWMEGVDLSNVSEKEQIGLNDSKCALVYNEKLGVFGKMLSIIEHVGEDMDLSDDDLFQMLYDVMPDQPGLKSPPSRGSSPVLPSGKKKKKPEKKQ